MFQKKSSPLTIFFKRLDFLFFQFGHYGIVMLFFMGIQAAAAILYAIWQQAVAAAAVLPQSIQGTEAEQTVEVFPVRPRVAGEKFTVLVRKEFIPLAHACFRLSA